jgi:hypothetical protein
MAVTTLGDLRELASQHCRKFVADGLILSPGTAPTVACQENPCAVCKARASLAPTTAKGTGLVEKPLHILGGAISAGVAMWTCRTCGGEKMIWTEDPHEATT